MQPGDTFRPEGLGNGDSSNKDEGTNATTVPAAAADAQENATWYRSEAPTEQGGYPAPGQGAEAGPNHGPSGVVSWTASEFVAHEKPLLWYVAFMFIALLIAAVTYLMTREIITVVAVIVALGAFGTMATRRPRVLNYVLDNRGVEIGSKTYLYSSFKSFSLYDDGALHAIDLLPMERFRPPVTVYFPPEQEQEVLSKLGENLPYENRSPDLVDRLMHRLRF